MNANLKRLKLFLAIHFARSTQIFQRKNCVSVYSLYEVIGAAVVRSEAQVQISSQIRYLCTERSSRAFSFPISQIVYKVYSQQLQFQLKLQRRQITWPLCEPQLFLVHLQPDVSFLQLDACLVSASDQYSIPGLVNVSVRNDVKGCQHKTHPLHLLHSLTPSPATPELLFRRV